MMVESWNLHRRWVFISIFRKTWKIFHWKQILADVSIFWWKNQQKLVKLLIFWKFYQNITTISKTMYNTILERYLIALSNEYILYVLQTQIFCWCQHKNDQKSPKGLFRKNADVISFLKFLLMQIVSLIDMLLLWKYEICIYSRNFLIEFSNFMRKWP